jgi:hypothetical protein
VGTNPCIKYEWPGAIRASATCEQGRYITSIHDSKQYDEINNK